MITSFDGQNKKIDSRDVIRTERIEKSRERELFVIKTNEESTCICVDRDFSYKS